MSLLGRPRNDTDTGVFRCTPAYPFRYGVSARL